MQFISFLLFIYNSAHLCPIPVLQTISKKKKLTIKHSYTQPTYTQNINTHIFKCLEDL